jgi:hypothetical protein
MRLRNLSLSLFFAMVGLAACGDDENDLKKPDAPKPPIDTPNAPVFKGFDADEGGEVRIEYVRFGGGNAATRAGAFFYDNPGSTRYWPFLNLNGCTDLSTDMNWPTAASPLAERTYLDPGMVILAGGPQALVVPRRAAMTNDVLGRTHPANAFSFHFGGGTATDGPTYLSEKTRYDVILTGSQGMPGMAGMPAQIFDDVLFMPADFQVINPPLSTTPFPIPSNTAQTFTWQTPANMEPMGYEVQSLVGFTGANGPAVICVEPQNDGSITVPANMIDIARAKYPNGGTLARQTLTHVVRELVDKNGPTGKRIDFLTIWCYATPFMTAP